MGRKEDRGKIIALIIIIVFVVLLLLGLIAIVILDITSDGPSTPKYSTTTRRTVIVSDDNKNDIDIEEDEEGKVTTTDEEETTTTSQVVNSTTVVSSTKEVGTSYKSSTSKKVVYESTSKVVVSTTMEWVEVKPNIDRETTSGETDYPNALNDWEWEVVNLVNKDRSNYGLTPLKVATRFRRVAEEASDMWLSKGKDEVKKYLRNNNDTQYASTRIRMSNDYSNETAKKIYTDLVNNSTVTTDKDLKYIGVGVIYKSDGIDNMPTYFSVVVFE